MKMSLNNKFQAYSMSLLLLLTCAAPFHSCNTAGKNVIAEQQDPRFDSRVLIIFYDKETGKNPLLESLSAYDATLVYSYKYVNGIAIDIPPDKDILEAIEYFKTIKGVLSVERDRKLDLHQHGPTSIQAL